MGANELQIAELPFYILRQFVKTAKKENPELRMSITVHQSVTTRKNEELVQAAFLEAFTLNLFIREFTVELQEIGSIFYAEDSGSPYVTIALHY